MESKPDLFNQRKAVSPQVCVTKNVGFYFPPKAALKTNIQTSNSVTKHNCLSKPALTHFCPALPPCAAPAPLQARGEWWDQPGKLFCSHQTPWLAWSPFTAGMSFTLCLFNTHSSCLFSCCCSENEGWALPKFTGLMWGRGM